MKIKIPKDLMIFIKEELKKQLKEGDDDETK